MQPDFDKALNKGHVTYDREVGDWWVKKCENPVHQAAYQFISKKVLAFFKKKHLVLPKVAIDYACGSGALLKVMSDSLPETQWIGLDGSQKLLDRMIHSSENEPFKFSFINELPPIGSKLNLAQTHLPNFSLTESSSDLIIWCFPNLIASEAHLNEYNNHGYQNEDNIAVAELLARLREMDPEDETQNLNQDEWRDELLSERVISWNINKLLKPGGVFVKVEYSNCPRKELTKLTKLRSKFTEGTLKKVNHLTIEPFFKRRKSIYMESEVIDDVFEQTGDSTDKEGGFSIHIYQKI